jgi:hypothetical protein
MFCYRLTKYNPVYRDSYGTYRKNEWTQYSDIGKTFDGKECTQDEYIGIENVYIQAIIDFMKCAGVSHLTIASLGNNQIKNKNTNIIRSLLIQKNIPCDTDIITFIRSLKKDMVIDMGHISLLLQLVFREIIWCKLEAPTMYVHFGWDFYVYIGIKKECEAIIKKIEINGLFVEPCPSIYDGDDDY